MFTASHAISISNLRVGESALTGQGRTHFIIRFHYFSLYNSCLLPDYNLLCHETIRNGNGEGQVFRSSMHLRLFYKTQLLVGKQFLSLSSMLIRKILFILESNVHNNSKVVLLNFQECNIKSSIDEEAHESFTNGCFPVFVRNLKKCSK